MSSVALVTLVILGSVLVTAQNVRQDPLLVLLESLKFQHKGKKMKQLSLADPLG